MKVVFNCAFLFLLLHFKDLIAIAHGSNLLFLLENDAIFDKCMGHPGNGFHDLINMSNFHIEINEYNMRAEGTAQVVWDVKPTDRISMHVDVFKYTRGTWQPTVWNLIQTNFCKVMFSPTEIWYEAFTSKFKNEDRQCINVNGAIYHLEPINQFLSLEMHSGNTLEGRHKFVFRFEAFDEMGLRRPNDVCYEIVGEFVKQ